MSTNQVRPQEKDISELVLLTIVLVILAVVLSILAYVMIVGLEPEPDLSTPMGSIQVEATSNTTAEVCLHASGYPPITRFTVELATGTNSGTYSFESATHGAIATLESGSDVGTITYWDLIDNKKVNSGDKLLLTNLNKNSDYTIYLMWAPNGDIIDQEDFTTPP